MDSASIETRLVFLEKREKLHGKAVQKLNEESLSMRGGFSELEDVIHDLVKQRLQREREENNVSSVSRLEETIHEIKGKQLMLEGAVENLTQKELNLENAIHELTQKKLKLEGTVKDLTQKEIQLDGLVCDLSKKQMQLERAYNKLKQQTDRPLDKSEQSQQQIDRQRKQSDERTTKMCECRGSFNEMEKLLSNVESHNSRMQDDLKGITKRLEDESNKNNDLSEKYKALSNKVDSQVKENNDLSEKYKALSNKVDNEVKENNDLSEKYKALSNKVDNEVKEIQQLRVESKKTTRYVDNQRSTHFSLGVKSSKPLVTSKESIFDSLDSVYKDSPHFRKSQRVFVPPSDGLCVLCVRIYQKGNGRMVVKVLREIMDDCPGVMFQVATNRDGEVGSGMYGMNVKKGHKYCLSVTREDGNAELHWCEFNGFMLY